MFHLRNKYSFNKHLCSSCSTPYTMLLGNSWEGFGEFKWYYLVIAHYSSSLCLEKAFERRDCVACSMYLSPHRSST